MSNKRLASNLFFNILSFAINAGIAFFFTPYLISVIGKEAFGFYPLATNIAGYSAIFSAALNSMAGRFIVMRYYDNDMEGANRYFNSVFVGNIALTLLLALPAAVVTVFINNVLDVPVSLLADVRSLFAFTFLASLLGTAGSVFAVATFVKNRVDMASSRTALLNLLRVALLVGLFALFAPSIRLVGYALFAIALITFGVNIDFTRKLTPELCFAPLRYYKRSALTEVVSSGIWNSFNQLSVVLMTQLDLLITNIFISAAATGDYSVAKTVPLLVQSFIGTIAAVFMPQFAILYAQNKTAQLSDEINKSVKLLGVFIALPIGFLLVYGDVFFMLWVPALDAAYLHKLSILTLIPMIVTGTINTVYNVYTVTNHLKVPALVWFVLGVLQTGTVFVVLKTTDLGIWTIPLVALIATLGRNLIFTPLYAAKCLQLPWHTFYKGISRGTACSVSVVLIGMLMRSIYVPDSWHTFILAGVITSSISIFIFACTMLSADERRQLAGKIPFLKQRFPQSVN